MKSLKDRWHSSPEWRKRHDEIVKLLTSGGNFAKISGLQQYEDRWDLRGITTPVVSPEGHKFSQRQFESKKIVFENVDLSYATLYESTWERCTFRNVTFTGVKLDYSKFWACKFENVKFENAYLNEVVMNASLKDDSGYFRNVTFIDSNLKGTAYTNTQFENCAFRGCKLNNVDFNGSRFQDCSFEGKLEEVYFRGNEMVNRELYPRKKTLPNPMLRVDFRKATLISVMFLDGVDLSTCMFPNSDDYIIIKNKIQVFEKVRKIVEDTWDGSAKNMALVLIDKAYLSPRSRNLKIDIVDRHYLRGDGPVSDIDGLRFFELIRSINNEVNGF
jgi:fluoroquinolone resistance protein